MRLKLLLITIGLFVGFASWGQTPTNGGFEATINIGTDWDTPGAATTTNARTGLNALGHTTSSASNVPHTNVTIISIPNNSYAHVIGWAKGSNANARASCGGTLNVTAASAPITTIGTTLTRLIYSVQNTSGSAKNFASRVNSRSASGSTTLYWDDVVMYTSTAITPDLTKPVTGTAFTNGSITSSSAGFSWTNGSDSATGIQNTIILRTSNLAAATPVMNDQGVYSITGGTSGPNVVTSDWTVLSTGVATSTTTYADATVTAGTTYKYAVIHRDLAYNYSAALVSGNIVVPAAGFTVTFKANGGTGADTTQTASSSTALTANAFTRTGYTFAGWNTINVGGGTAYANGASYPFTANETLYAQWTINNYIVSYDGNFNTGGSAPADQSGNYNTSITLSNNTGTLDKTGFTFAGWNTQADGLGTDYAEGAPYTIPANNSTLFAKWQSTTPTITASGTPAALSTTYGTASSTTSFSVSGANLTGNILITAPTGFEVSTISSSGFGNTLTLNQSGGTVANTQIYVRLAATTPFGTYSGNITLASTGVTTVNVAIASSTVATKTLTITGLTQSNKVYDGTSTATVTGTPAYDGLVLPDAFLVSDSVTWAFSSANVGATLTRTGTYTAPSSNYTVTQPTLTANITAKALTISAATIASKVYDASAVSGTVTVGTLSGLIGTQTLGISATGAYADATVGTAKSATITYVLANGSNGGLAANYSLANGTGTGDITKANPVFSSSTIAVSVGGTYALPGSISSTSPGTLSYSITGGGYATLAGSTITGVSTGTETLTVNQATSTNYNAGSTTVSVSVTNISYPLNSFLSTTGSGSYTSTTSTWSKCGSIGGCTGTTIGSGGWGAVGASGQVPIAGSTAFIQGDITGGTTGITDMTILSGGILTTSGNYPISSSLTVKTGGTLNIASNLNFNNTAAVFTVEDGADVVITSYTTNPNTSLWNGVEVFSANSTVTYNYCRPDRELFDAATVIETNPATEAKFGNLIIQPTVFSVASTNWTGIFPTGTYTLTKGNFIVNNSSDRNFTFNGGDITVGGTMTVNVTSTGAVATRSSAGTSSITVNGNLIKNGSGMFRLNGGGTFTLNVDGDLQINSGIFRTGVVFSTSVLTIVNLKGDLSATATSVLDSNNTTVANVNFNFTGKGTGLAPEATQTIDIATTTATSTNENKYISFNVKSGAYVKLSNRDFELGTNSKLTVESGGTFDFGFNGTTPLTIAVANAQTGQIFSSLSGSTIKLTSPYGITTAAAASTSGNVQTPVAGRTFDAGATYHYIGKANQVTGNGLPNAAANKHIIVELDADNLEFTSNNGIIRFNNPSTAIGTIFRGLEIRKGTVIADDSGARFDDGATGEVGNLKMSGGIYKIFTRDVQPAFNGNYDLSAGSKIIFAHTTAASTTQGIRGATSYQYPAIEIEGRDVRYSNVGINMKSNGLFTVKENAILTNTGNVGQIVSLDDANPATLIVKNLAIFKTEKEKGFNGAPDGINPSPSVRTNHTSGNVIVVLEAGSTVEYSRNGNQIITLVGYSNLTVSGTETKTLSSNTLTTVGNNLSVNASTLLIESGKALTVTNKVDVNTAATMTINDSGSLVQVNDAAVNSGNIRYERTTPLVRNTDYTYWSSPVADYTLGGVSQNLTVADKYYSYNSAVDDWQQASAATPMIPGIGYIIRGPEPIGPIPPGTPDIFEAFFVGKPNNGEYKISGLSLDKSYLLGNPYPSALDAETFLNANAGVLNGTLYFWTHNTDIQLYTDIITAGGTPGTGVLAYTSDDYAAYNATGGVAVTQRDIDPNTGLPYPGPSPSGSLAPSGKIASGQGFFASTKTTLSGSPIQILYNNSMRVGVVNILNENNSQFFKTKNPQTKTAAIEKHRIWLNLRNTQGVFKQTLIGYLTDATNQYDSRFDGETFDGNEFVDFYSINQDKNLVIQGRSLPFDENDEIPLGFRTTIEGPFTINIDQVDGLLTNQAVFIEDKLTNTVFDLKTGNYTFNTAAGTFNDRFVLRYTNKTLGTKDLETLENQVLVSNKNKQIQINSNTETIDKIMVYDLLGRLLFKKDKVNSNELAIPNLFSSQQTLLVKVILQNGQTVTKKIMY